MSTPDVAALDAAVDAALGEREFSGVVRVDRGDQVLLERAVGWTHRALGVPMTIDTRLAVASGTKSLTALTVLALVEHGALDLDTTARELLGTDLPLVDDTVTVKQLLAHRSGIGDYFDEDAGLADDAYVLPVPVHTLATAEDYLSVLDGFPQVFPAGERFAYNNEGFVVLAILAERAAGRPYPDLVRQHVLAPAGLTDTDFPRSDSLGARTAVGYLDATGDRANVLHLPLLGVGDGGAYTTVADVHRLWRALRAGAVVSPATRDAAWTPLSEVPDEAARYGLGFWLAPAGPSIAMLGGDAGISFRSVHDPPTDLTHTVISNWTDGAWPLTRALDAVLGTW